MNENKHPNKDPNKHSYSSRFTLRTEKNSKKSDEVLELCELVIHARLISGLSQTEFAKKLGTKQPNIARIEKGLIEPSISFLMKVATAINTKLILPKFEKW